MANHRLEAGAGHRALGILRRGAEAADHRRHRRHRHDLDGVRPAGAVAEGRASPCRPRCRRSTRTCSRSSAARTSSPGRWRCAAPRRGRCSRCASSRSICTTTGATTRIRPLAGALPDDFKEMRIIHIPLDKERMVGKLSWGARNPAQAVLRHHGGGAAGRLGADQLAAAAAQRRQPRQQGTGRRHHALSADPHRRRAVLLRRRPRRAGRRRGLHHRDRDRADRHVRAASCAPT